MGLEEGEAGSARSQILSLGAIAEAPQAVLHSYFSPWANLKTECCSVFKVWGHTSLLGNVVVLFISCTLYGVLLAEQCIGFSVPMHRSRGRLASVS